MTQLTLLVNPRAGAGRAETILPRVEKTLRELGATFEVVRTEARDDATRLARKALAEGREGVAVIGGDGTLSEATNGFFDEGKPVRADAWLAPISSGTGGDFRKSIGASNVGTSGATVEEVVARVWRSRPRPIDVGHLRYVSNDGTPAQRMFLNIASFGIGGLVDQLVNDAPKWMGGGPAFFVGILRALARYRPQRVRVRVDGREAREPLITNLAVANGQFFGGGLHVAPAARLDDGLFDVVTLHALGTRSALGLTPYIYRGKHVGRRGVDVERGAVVEAEPVDPSEHVLLDVDGEAPGRLPARFEIRERALLLRG
jgi:YegS/Rv2252/BmrU family lipid kinase